MPVMYLAKVNLLFEMGRYADSVCELREVLAQYPEDAVAHAMMGVALARLGLRGEALRAANEAIRLDPTEAYVFYAKSLVLVSLGRPARAARAVREAIRLANDDPRYFYFLAVIESMRRRWNRCLTALDAALALAPEDPDCLRLRGESLQNLDRWDEARQAFRQALAADPASADTHFARGALRLAEIDLNAADDLLEARRIDPIARNELEPIALAVGRQMAPFRWINQVLPRWHLWRPKALWALMIALLLTFVALQTSFPTMEGAKWKGLGSALGALFAFLAANVLVGSITCDALAVAAALLVTRRAAWLPWYRRLFQLPAMLLIGAIHLGVVTCCTVPLLFVFALCGCSCSTFVTRSFRAILDRHLTVLAYAPYGILLVTTACVAALSAEIPQKASLVSVLVFAVPAFFSDNVARTIHRWEA